MQAIRTAQLIENRLVGEATHLLRLQTEGAARFEPGQFLQVWCDSDWPMFEPNNQPSRPFAILGSQIERGEFSLLVRDRGPRSHWLTSRQNGDEIRFYGPLGMGFDITEVRAANWVLLVAEAIGVVQLAELARRLIEAGKSVTVIATTLANRTIPREIISSTPNFNYQLEITEQPAQALINLLAQPDYADYEAAFFSLAPRTYPALLKAKVLGQVGGAFDNPPLYFQKTLPCGVGACMQCAIDTIGGKRLVCDEGPVFRLREIEWRV